MEELKELNEYLQKIKQSIDIPIPIDCYRNSEITYKPYNNLTIK